MVQVAEFQETLLQGGISAELVGAKDTGVEGFSGLFHYHPKTMTLLYLSALSQSIQSSLRLVKLLCCFYLKRKFIPMLHRVPFMWMTRGGPFSI